MDSLLLFMQIISLVFYYKFLDSSDDYEGNASYSIESIGWYIIAGCNLCMMLRFIFVQITYSYDWFDQILECIAFLIAFIIVFPTSIYLLIKRRRRLKRERNKTLIK